MHFGIDFGTTRTIVATVDRGNYPVVSFDDTVGDSHDYFPSVVADVDGRLVYGFEALAAGGLGHPMVRSFKRTLADPWVNANTAVQVGDRQVSMLELLTGFLKAIRAALAEASSLELPVDAPAEAVIAVPAHAYSAQRFVTLEAFRGAGFNVMAMINEPSAAGFEYTHRKGKTVTSKRTRVIVYDLGGGTFDASLVDVRGLAHEVLDSTGINHLGGDDFDAVLADMALGQAGLGQEALGVHGYFELLDECRGVKERLSPQTKRMVIELNDTPVTVLVDDYYEAVTPLVQRTLDAMLPLVGGLDAELTDVAGIYLVGGASGLPLVSRMLRDTFGRRVYRSPYPAASTAIGLAIAADDTSGFSLSDRLSRGFGVFREGESGQLLQFDELLSRDARISATEAVQVQRVYRAAHNIGWFRFVEYASSNEHGDPKGDLVPFAEVIFPFDASLQGRPDLREVPVEHSNQWPLIEETYTIDPHGIIEVRLANIDGGYAQTYSLAPLA